MILWWINICSVWFLQPQFLVALAAELVDSNKSQVCRMAAALQLKNQLTSKDERMKLAYQQRWLGLEDTIKSAVKTRASILMLHQTGCCI